MNEPTRRPRAIAACNFKRRDLSITVAAILTVHDASGAQVVTDLTTRIPSGRISEQLETVRFANELADGRLLITVGRRPTPLVADFSSATVLPVSTEGDGPGEFRRPYWILALGNDSTVVAEEAGHRWVVLSGTKPVATLRAWLPSAMAVILAGADTLGRVMEIATTKLGTERGERVYVSPTNAESTAAVLHRRGVVSDGSALGSIADTVARLRGPFRGVRNVWQAPPGSQTAIQYHLSQPLAAEEQALLFKDGWIAIAYADPYRVDWITPSGARVRGSEIQRERVPVDDTQRKAVLAAEWPSGPAPFKAGDYPPWPEYLPPFLFRSLLSLPNGHLAIKRTPDARQPNTAYDVVDRGGRLTGTIRLGKNERILAFGRTSVYVVRVDNDGLNQLFRYSWPQ